MRTSGETAQGADSQTKPKSRTRNAHSTTLKVAPTTAPPDYRDFRGYRGYGVMRSCDCVPFVGAKVSPREETPRRRKYDMDIAWGYGVIEFVLCGVFA